MAKPNKQQTDILANEPHLKSILDASPIGAAISGYENGTILYVNPALARMWGEKAEKLLGTESSAYFPNQEDFHWVSQQLREHDRLNNHEIQMRRADGSTLWCQVNLVVTRINQTRVILTWFNDTSEIRRTRARLKHMATHDFLTGLANRIRFNEFVDEAIARSKRSNKAGGVLYLDLDGFKAVNDRYGHHFGDMLLAQVAKRLTSTLRQTDFVARIGGDEFAVVVEAHSNRAWPEIVAQKIINAVAPPFEDQGRQVSIGVSIGIAYFGPGLSDREVITRRADQAMYRAKRCGKNRICIYTPNLDETPLEGSDSNRSR